ncbi:aldo/keto reductase [Parenemella sanctibonifatiensis]|uniref:Aldo/keto reductase n=1 Tax=Parenemella sanctibonifatiensis TaxID=2016505 RepID=A0A255EEV2_9ACTN|nr:aldo/keto reductase [Parenemella sanctibonifatiensis]OYN90076.1 aldo/keto reductase [Parenemella sanctibonifatiensis]
MRRVGASGLSVGRVGLGTLTWGRDTSPETAAALLRDFTEAGGNLVDTAAAYSNGEAERILAAAMKANHLHREDLVLATKAGFGVRQGERTVDTSAKTMLSDLTASLRRLETDHVDLWQVHAWGGAPLAETLAAMDRAVSLGMVRYVGISNYVGWQTGEAVTWQRAVPGRNPIVSSQVEYSLLARRAEFEVLQAVRAYDLGFFPWAPLGRGVLSGKYREETPRGSRGASPHFAWFVDPYLTPRNRSIVEAVARAAAGLELDPVQVALLWVRDAPGVTAPLVGPRNTSQLAPLLAAEYATLPAEIIAALDDVSGGPVQGRE